MGHMHFWAEGKNVKVKGEGKEGYYYYCYYSYCCYYYACAHTKLFNRMVFS